LACAVFVAGGGAFARAIAAAVGRKESALATSLFWALSAAPMLTGIVTTKLEIAITGLVLLAAAGLISSPNRIWPGFICALITSWKFQPLPIVLLWCVMLFRIRETRGFFVGLVLGAVIALVLPFFVLPWPYLFHEQHVWLTTLREFSNRSYLDFENIFAFFRHALGLPPGPLAMRALCLLGALAAAFVVWGWMGGAKKPLSKPELISRATLLSAGLGSAYAVAFSPLGQNNALILCAPLLFWISCTLFLGIKDLWERAVLSVCLAVILAVPYSDLVPLDLRDRLHAISFKQMVLLGVACGLAWTWTRRDRAWRAGAKGTVSSRRFTL
ncbi:MAG TPA: glycosyltransferase 87 family protein, partial [Bdellovibrionota bacterium]|nr:glycosyltransferase 87 family protein [Bdellovibrionota bacterium]